jgi:predicted nucleic acid-binding protein
MNTGREKVVVDTSLALKWVIYESDTPSARALLSQWIKQDFIIAAPDLLIYEITNVFYKSIRRNMLSLEKAISAFEILIQIGLTYTEVKDEKLSLQALDFARQFKLPATYDAHYLALAEREGCEFWTADARLYHAVREQLAWVRLMADDPAASTPA